MDATLQTALEIGRACHLAAIQYIEKGWSALALCPSDHLGIRSIAPTHHQTCKSPGKSPWYPWQEYSSKLSTKQDLERWWKLVPNANVGVALGTVSQLIRVDCDGPAGKEKLLALANGTLPETLCFRGDQHKGGFGLLYTIPEGFRPRTRSFTIVPGEELRLQGNGAQTVLPPSHHHTGCLYSWLTDCDPVMAPDWLLALMEPLSANPQQHEAFVHSTAAPLVLSPDANPPTEKLMKLLEHRTAKQAFNRTRQQADMSASGQDFTLALLAVAQGWTRQEIADLLISCRRCHNEELLLGNRSYYTHTLDAAMAKAGSNSTQQMQASIVKTAAEEAQHAELRQLFEEPTTSAAHASEDQATEPTASTNGAASPPSRDDLLTKVNQILGTTILRVICHMAEEPTYRIVFARHPGVLVGTAEAMCQQARLRWRLARANGNRPPTQLKPKAWDDIVQALIAIAEEEACDEKEDPNFRVVAWLRDFFAHDPPLPEDQQDKAIAYQRSFQDGAAIGFFLRTLQSWLKYAQGYDLGTGALGTLLHRGGCVLGKKNYRCDNVRTSRSVWLVSCALLGEVEAEEPEKEPEKDVAPDETSSTTLHGELP